MSSSDCQVVSLREAARRLGLPLTSFRRIAQAEPRLQACIHPGRPAKVDLERLLIVWHQLEQADKSALSPRQELALERRKRLWWQGRSLLLQLQEEESRFCDAEQIQIVEKEVFALLEKLMKSWAKSIAPQLLDALHDSALVLVFRLDAFYITIILFAMGSIPELYCISVFSWFRRFSSAFARDFLASCLC